VLRVWARGQREETTVVGSLPSVAAGEWLVAEGWWVRDTEHGLQFKATTMKTVPPTTTEGIERYLGSGLVKGIGPRGRYVAALLHAGSKIGVSVGRFCSGTWQGERAGIVNPDSYTLAGYDLLLGQSEPSLTNPHPMRMWNWFGPSVPDPA
jgi:hypothetical protein